MSDNVRDESQFTGDPQERSADRTSDAARTEDQTGSGDTGEGAANTEATPPDNSLGVPPGP